MSSKEEADRLSPPRDQPPAKRSFRSLNAQSAWLELRLPHGQVNRVPVGSAQLTVGSAPPADIVVKDVPELLAEHLLVTPRPDGCWVACAQGATLVPHLEGKRLQAGLVPWGTEIVFGPLKLRFTKHPRAALLHAPWYAIFALLLAVLVVPLAAWLALAEEPLPQPDLEVKSSLFEGFFPLETKCDVPNASRVQSAQAAAYRGESMEREAGFREERYPFQPREGVLAVIAWSVAERCFTAAEQEEDQSRAQAAKESMMAKVETDLRGGELRLQRAIELERFDEAVTEADHLGQLVAHLATDHPYRLWLDRLQLQLRIREYRAGRQEGS
ncbi:MAG: FHA domain-containing protein [Myxococcota bacterium]